jgi:hypothetical protein
MTARHAEPDLEELFFRLISQHDAGQAQPSDLTMT